MNYNNSWVSEERLDVAINTGFIKGDRERMCKALIERLKIMDYDLTILRGGYKTLDYLYEQCKAERDSLRAQVMDKKP